MVIGFIIRSGLAVGAVYYSRELGVWGNSEQTEMIYNNTKDLLRPYVQELSKQIPFEVPALPKSGEVCFLVNHYYNEGVKSTFHFIHMLPCYTGQMLQKAKNAFEEFSQSPPPAAASQQVTKVESK